MFEKQDAQSKASILTVEHDRADAEGTVFDDLPNVASLFLQLTHGTCFWRLIGVHKAGRNLNDCGINGWAPLFLKNNTRLKVGNGRILEYCGNTDTVNVRPFRPGETLGRFPRSLDTFWIAVGGSRA